MKSEQNLIAQNTEFGWVVSGACSSGPGARVLAFMTNVELQKSLKKFFEPYEFENDTNSDLTDEEAYCEDHFIRTVRRDVDGRFTVTLLFKNEMTRPDLRDSRKCAIATQFQLEQSFLRNPKLHEEYEKFIRESIELGHIEEVDTDSPLESSSAIHYMPHHCVFKNSMTTALRVVYNASQKTANGKSLNEQFGYRPFETNRYFIIIN